jgi:ABC-2 type transport system permease protein
MSTWSAVVLVARREFRERLRDRSFLVSTMITMLILLAVIVIPPLFGIGEPQTFNVGLTGSNTAAYETAVREQAAPLNIDVTTRTVDGVEQARSQVTDGELYAALTDDGIVVDSELPPELEAVLQGAHGTVQVLENLSAEGVNPGEAQQALAVEPLAVVELTPQEEGSGERRGIAFIGTIVLYGQIVGYGFWVALGVVEEKSSRVVEVLLSTISARALLAGKVLGIGLLGLLQLLLIAVIGVGAALLTDRIELNSNVIEPVLLVLGWFVLGYGFYACFFAAAPARVSRQEELQNATTPATMLIVVSFFGALYANSSPDSALAQVLSWVPPFSALVQPVLAAAGDSSLIETLLAVAIMIVATVALVLVAARLYEGAVLRTGAKVPLREAWAQRARS